jgi:ACS family hexuronate transporter-like MFS transporter
MRKIPHLRWHIIGLIFFASVLNYVDRQTLSILAPTIQTDLGLSDQDYASIVNLFLVAYTIAYLISGRMVDKLGVRVSFALFVLWWSVANMLTAFARSFGSLGACRFLLGLGEAGNWTAAPKAVSEWFSPRERGLAIGIYTLGATLGATLAPVMIVALASWHSWQAAFVVTGALGLLWLVPWWFLYRRPEEHPRITPEELASITESRAVEAQVAVADGTAGVSLGWRDLLRRRDIWLLLFARLLTDPVWYFYQFWFAKYLFSARGLDQKSLTVSWVIFLAADIGALAGGWLSGHLISRKFKPATSRVVVMAVCAACMPMTALLPHVPMLWFALGLGMVASLAHMSWLINLSSLIVDLIPTKGLATAFGIIAAGSVVGGIAMNWGVGWLVTNYSYTHAFTIAAVLHPLAFFLIWRLRAASPSSVAPAATA